MKGKCWKKIFLETQHLNNEKSSFKKYVGEFLLSQNMEETVKNSSVMKTIIVYVLFFKSHSQLVNRRIRSKKCQVVEKSSSIFKENSARVPKYH